MFGIGFAPAKLRAITTIDPSGNFVLYTREWVPIVVPFDDAKAFITSLGITYNLKRDTASISLALCKKLRGIAGVLGGRQASKMARAIAQNLYTLPQILYFLQFYCFSETQHITLTALLLKPLRGWHQAPLRGADELRPWRVHKQCALKSSGDQAAALRPVYCRRRGGDPLGYEMPLPTAILSSGQGLLPDELPLSDFRPPALATRNGWLPRRSAGLPPISLFCQSLAQAISTLKTAVIFTSVYRPSPLRRRISSTPMTWAVWRSS
jgi:hypothetical protein